MLFGGRESAAPAVLGLNRCFALGQIGTPPTDYFAPQLRDCSNSCLAVQHESGQMGRRARVGAEGEISQIQPRCGGITPGP